MFIHVCKVTGESGTLLGHDLTHLGESGTLNKIGTEIILLILGVLKFFAVFIHTT